MLQDWKKLYEREYQEKCREAKAGEDGAVPEFTELPSKRGRPLLLGGKQLDMYLRSYVIAMRFRGTPSGMSSITTTS